MENDNTDLKLKKEIIFEYIKKRMVEKKINQNELAKIIGVNKSTLVRNFKGHKEMLLITYLKICSVLDLIPYLEPKELKEDKCNSINFD